MRRRVATSLVSLALLLSGPAIQAQEVPEALAGTWHGGGEVRGMKSEQSMTWSSELGGRFMRLDFENRMESGDGATFLFQAHAYYRVAADGQIDGAWFDSRGVQFPLRGQRTATGMIIEWGTPELEQGRSEYRLLDGRLLVIDEVMGKDGEFRGFGRSELQRAR